MTTTGTTTSTTFALVLLTWIALLGREHLVAAQVEPLAACFDGTTSVFSKDDWDHCQELVVPNGHQTGDDLQLFLYYKPLMEQGLVKVGLHATKDTFGWTALALAGNGGMKGASQIVVRKRMTDNNNDAEQEVDDDQWVAEDRHSQDYVTPALDGSQDVKLLFASQSDEGETAWGVLLPLNSCDEDGLDYPIQNVSTYMHWALGTDHTFAYHGTRRGQFHANLLEPPKVIPAVEPEATYIDFRMPNVTVELGEGGSDPTNPYICGVFDAEQMGVEENTTIHLTRMVAVLDEDSEEYVHHMILYACDGDQDGFEHNQVIDHCESMPAGCYEMKYAWAVGAQEVILPDDVGLPIGGSGQRWLVLQMHYFNPNLHENVQDSSGSRAYYTNSLRPQEAGIMQLNGGTGPFMRPPIPAGQSSISITPFVIPSTCTASNWAEPLNILGVAHHMHISGKTMTIEVERDGQQIGTLRNEKGYDFNHQSLEPSPIRQLLPGDQLIMHCTYDTSGRTEDVAFGDFTQTEMCYAPILYYPKQEEGDEFIYLPPDVAGMEKTECLTPGTGAFANVSQCSQSFYESVPTFLDIEVPDDFDALTMCNSDFYVTDIQPNFPGLCPDCYESKTCTADEVVIHAQYGVCPYFCSTYAGVSVFPNVTDSVGFSQAVWGCSTEGSVDGGLFLFESPELAPAPVCEKVGDLSASTEEEDEVAVSASEREDETTAAGTGETSSTASDIGEVMASTSGGQSFMPTFGMFSFLALGVALTF